MRGVLLASLKVDKFATFVMSQMPPPCFSPSHRDHHTQTL
jgi:hypothetical protein